MSNNNLVIQELKAQVAYEKIEDEKFIIAISEGEEQEERLQTNTSIYNDHYSKLSACEKAIGDKQVSQEFAGMFDTIDSLDKNSYFKLTTKLAYGTIVSAFKDIQNKLSPEALLMLATSFRFLDSEDIDFYGSVLIEPELTEAMMDKSDKLDEQTHMATMIMDEVMGEFPGYYVANQEQLDRLVAEGLYCIETYQPTVVAEKCK